MNKTIHYFLEGEQPYDYRESWKVCCPDYNIVHWHAGNMPYEEYPFLHHIRDSKKWSVMSDFLRHWAVNKFGGFYLDTDVELIRSLDPLLEESSFLCIEGHPISGNAAVSGGHIGAYFQGLCLQEICSLDMPYFLKNTFAEIEISPRLVTRIIVKHKGFELDESDLNEVKDYKNFKTLPKKYFYPYNWNERFEESCITEDTIGIHWWKHSWK